MSHHRYCEPRTTFERGNVPARLQDMKLYQCIQRDQVVITRLREMYIVADLESAKEHAKEQE
jgi:hypothetical protein